MLADTAATVLDAAVISCSGVDAGVDADVGALLSARGAHMLLNGACCRRVGGRVQVQGAAAKKARVLPAVIVLIVLLRGGRIPVLLEPLIATTVAASVPVYAERKDSPCARPNMQLVAMVMSGRKA